MKVNELKVLRIAPRRILIGTCGAMIFVAALTGTYTTESFAQSQASAVRIAAASAPSSVATPVSASLAAAPSPQASNAPSSPSAAGTSVAPAPRNTAATVNLVDGQAKVIGPDKTSRVPAVGDKIYEGDAIVTGDGAEMHLDMADGGFIAVRPNTQVKISSYQANGDSDDKSVIGLLKGSLRSITGWIGKTHPKNYAVVTPNATIGVRGTDHEPAFIPDGTPGTESGTYDQVHEGGTTITNPSGHVDVTPNTAGFVSPKHEAPRLLDHVPAFFNAPHRHDGAFVGKHAAVLASMQQKLEARKVEHAQELRQRGQAPGRSQARAPERTERTERTATSLQQARGEAFRERIKAGAASRATQREAASAARASPSAARGQSSAHDAEVKAAEEKQKEAQERAKKRLPKRRDE